MIYDLLMKIHMRAALRIYKTRTILIIQAARSCK
jgi:hypothetical protein